MRPINVIVRYLVLMTALIAALTTAAPASAFRLGGILKPRSGNPAERLVSHPIELSVYEPARRCVRTRRPGMQQLEVWMARNVLGRHWGTYRCERWGRGRASLHAEGRALDWHLNAGNASDRREARRFINLLLAPDRAGNVQALARRMGVEELIWDCSYWAAGMMEFRAYSPCLSPGGRVRRHMNRTIAHRDHVHIGMTRDGAMGRTSFWRGGRGTAPVTDAGPEFGLPGALLLR